MEDAVIFNNFFSIYNNCIYLIYYNERENCEYYKLFNYCVKRSIYSVYFRVIN